MSDDITATRIWEGILNEATIVFEVSGKEALTSREIFDALPYAVGAKFADLEGGQNGA